MRSSIWIAFLVAAGGCSSEPALWGRKLDVRGPLRVGQEAVWVDATRGFAVGLDPTGKAPSTSRVSIPLAPTLVTTTPQHDALLVLTPGHEAVKTSEQPEPPQLTVVVPGGGGALAVARSYRLGAPFDHLAVSPDGKLAIAHFTDGSSAGAGEVFRNPNELAVIDLTQPAGEHNPAPRTVRSLGSAPLGITFSPLLTVDGQPRALAVVLAPDEVTLIDLAHLDRSEVTIPLTPPDGTATVTPRQIAFDPAAATVYVRADGAPDVFALVLEARPSSDPTANDFLPHINVPSAGKTVSDMMLFGDGGKRWLLTVNASADLSLIDTATGDVSVIAIGAPVDTVLPIGSPPTEAVVYSRGTPQPTVTFVTLAGLSTGLARNLSRRTLAQPVHDLVTVPPAASGSTDKLLVVHDDDRTVVSVLDLGKHRVDSPILGQVRLASYDFAGGYLVGVGSDLDRLGVLQLETLNPSGVALEYPPARVLAVGGHIVVDHAGPGGLATIVPSPTATRAETTVVWDFLLAGALDDHLGG